MDLPFIKSIPNFAWFFIILIFKENCGRIAGLKSGKDGKFMLVETPDNENSQDPKYLLVNKGNRIKSLIKIDSNKGTRDAGKKCQDCSRYECQRCSKGFICKWIMSAPGVCIKAKECKENEDCFQYCAGWGRPVCITEDKICRCSQAIGRPFTVNGRSYTTISRGDRVDDLELEKSWINKKFQASFPNTSYDQEIGIRWIESAEAEHASIASFARHTLQLLSLNAPADLLIASQTAAIDEVRHTEASYGVANAVLKTTIKPDVLDIQQGLENLSSEEIMKSIIQEGCIDETLSAIELNMAADIAGHPLLKQLILQMAREEANHAQLAWNTIQWLNEKHPERKIMAENTFQTEFKYLDKVESERLNLIDTPRCEDDTKENILKNFGILGNDAMKARKLGLDEIKKFVVNDHSNLIADRIMNFKFL